VTFKGKNQKNQDDINNETGKEVVDAEKEPQPAETEGKNEQGINANFMND